MKTVVTGGRDYTLTSEDLAFLDELATTLPITHLLTGAASGADADAEAWAARRGLSFTRVPADWKHYGRGAGPKRNAQLASLAEAVIAFPGGRGTLDMVTQATRRNLSIFQSPSRLAACSVHASQ